MGILLKTIKILNLAIPNVGEDRYQYHDVYI